MALTKSSVVVANDIAMTAGAANVTSADQDISASYEVTCRIRITNTAAVGVAGQCSVQISEDTTAGNYMQLALVKSGDLLSGTVAEYVIAIPDAATHLRFVSGSNTTHDCTLRIVLDKVTGL